MSVFRGTNHFVARWLRRKLTAGTATNVVNKAPVQRSTSPSRVPEPSPKRSKASRTLSFKHHFSPKTTLRRDTSSPRVVPHSHYGGIRPLAGPSKALVPKLPTYGLRVPRRYVRGELPFIRYKDVTIESEWYKRMKASWGPSSAFNIYRLGRRVFTFLHALKPVQTNKLRLVKPNALDVLSRLVRYELSLIPKLEKVAYEPYPSNFKMSDGYTYEQSQTIFTEWYKPVELYNKAVDEYYRLGELYLTRLSAIRKRVFKLYSEFRDAFSLLVRPRPPPPLRLSQRVLDLM